MINMQLAHCMIQYKSDQYCKRQNRSLEIWKLPDKRYETGG